MALNTIARFNTVTRTAVRSYATGKSSSSKSVTLKPPSSPAVKQPVKQSIAAVQPELAKPGPPSNKYEAEQYFGYNQYSYNDLISEMQKFRLPQPAAK